MRSRSLAYVVALRGCLVPSGRCGIARSICSRPRRGRRFSFTSGANTCFARSCVALLLGRSLLVCGLIEIGCHLIVVSGLLIMLGGVLILVRALLIAIGRGLVLVRSRLVAVREGVVSIRHHLVAIRGTDGGIWCAAAGFGAPGKVMTYPRSQKHRLHSDRDWRGDRELMSAPTRALGGLVDQM